MYMETTLSIDKTYIKKPLHKLALHLIG